MAKIAIDIVLLPPEEIMDKAIEINQELLEKFPKKTILDKQKCIPHISLAMGVVEESKLSKVEEILREISKGFQPLSLTITNIKAGITPSGLKFCGFQIERTTELQALHETVMKKLQTICTYDVTLDMLYSKPTPEAVSLHWIRTYPTKSSFENFTPHLTIGCGETSSGEYSIKFTAVRLAICHLGNYCTCRKILSEVNLQNR